MKNRHMEAFRLMLMRRRRLDKKFNDILAAHRREHLALHQQARQMEAEVSEQTVQLEHQDGRIVAMTSGAAPFSAREFNDCRLYREVIVERRSVLETEWQRACTMVAQNEQLIAETLARILANQSRIEVYEARVAELQQLAERSADDEQDEEAEQNRLTGARPGFTAGARAGQRHGERQ